MRLSDFILSGSAIKGVEFFEHRERLEVVEDMTGQKADKRLWRRG